MSTGDMDATISVLLPTYKRHDTLTQTLESMEETMARPTRVELVAHVVYSDKESLDILKVYADQILVSDVIGHSRLPEMINGMADVATGDWLFVAGDDTIFETRGWDDMIRRYKHTVPTLLRPRNDRGVHNWYPIISRPVYTATGMVTPTQYHDVWLEELFRRSAKWKQNVFGVDFMLRNLNVHNEGLTSKQRDTLEQEAALAAAGMDAYAVVTP